MFLITPRFFGRDSLVLEKICGRFVFESEKIPVERNPGFWKLRSLNRGDSKEIFKVPALWSEVLAGKGASLATSSRDLNPRVAFPSDACNSFLRSRLFSRLFLPSASEMGTESGPDSSSIGSGVRSNRLRVFPTESMDSSNSSLDLTAAAKNPKALITRNTSPAEGSQYPPIGPPSLEGRDTIEQMSKLPLECRQVSFLVSQAALKRCSVWGEMSVSKGDEALAEYKKALEVMSLKKDAPKRAISTDDEVQFIGSNKRRAGAAPAPSSSKKKSKVSGSSPKESPSAPYDWATVLNNLNTKVFSSTPVLLVSEEVSSTAIQSLQGDLLEVASQLYHLGERIESAVSTKVEIDNLTSQLRKEKDAVLAKDMEIKELTLKLKEREEELIDLKDTVATFDVDKTMAMNGAKVVARWELMREWLSGQTDSWDPVTTLEQYIMVKITEAEFLGLLPPSFEHEPKVPGCDEKKTPEPSADDPPPN
ncbi:hypothetical protein HID58_022587 [Brassica napus]|uniref:Uncharacterized protein n=1 Tax=Brassica napus TaxID=3708 RepID=A0ABQ8CZP1_BRANA|nr:hypothetical protein HID58_022587 [Brassica napus]